ncbi:SpoIIE family protein phosphatase [Streptomyces sp. NPDC048550]|uniref:SpoIIE family protein phosphatase n=1 Tax=unclassified Streptomyces TaxID=2593676 RepID=UPI003415D445
MDLQPGDRLVMVTDGMPERRAVEVDLPPLIADTRDLYAREASRALVAEVLRAHGGLLQDDATVMCLDWHGTHQDKRSADAGADLTEASAPE